MKARFTASIRSAKPFVSCSQNAYPKRRRYVMRQGATQQKSPFETCLASVLAGAVAVPLLLWPPHSAALTPYEESKRMVYGPTADGSIRGCPSNVRALSAADRLNFEVQK